MAGIKPNRRRNTVEYAGGTGKYKGISRSNTFVGELAGRYVNGLRDLESLIAP